MIDLSTLQPGQPVFVEIWGDIYAGTVVRQFTSERDVQVKTEGAKRIMQAWQHMSFRWSDGKAVACKLGGQLHVPITEEEHRALDERRRRFACRFDQDLGLELAH
jgi:hypothetical protein